MMKQRNYLFFVGEVPEHGYRIIETAAPDGSDKKFLAEERYLLGAKMGKQRRYDPLRDHPDLFLEFANLSPSHEEQILEFTNRYGFLQQASPIGIEPSTKNTLLWGEPLSLWASEITTMKQAIELWGMVKQKKKEKLAKVIRWHGPSVRYQAVPLTVEKEAALLRGKWDMKADGIPQWIVLPQHDPWAFGEVPEIKPGDVIGPAWMYLQSVFQKYFSVVSARLLWERVDENKPGMRLGVYFTPDNLLGALWLQFAQNVAGNREFQRCQYCTRPFIARPNKINCSDSCKSMMSRQHNKKKLSAKRKLKTR